MTETVHIENKIGRDLTLSYVASRQEINAKGGEKISIPVNNISHTLKNGKTTEVPSIVWDSQKDQPTIKYYLDMKPPKLAVVELSGAVAGSGDDELDDEEIQQVAEIIQLLLSEGKTAKKIKVSDLNAELEFKVTAEHKKQALELIGD